MDKRNYTIDIIRVIMALMIVAVHTSPLIEYSAIISYFPSQVLSRLGVPFFAAVAGYFYFKNVNNFRVINSLKKYSSLYCFWSVIMFGYMIISGSIGGGIRDVATYILQTFFLTGFYHLWYMLAMIYTMLIVWGLSKTKSGLEYLYYISFALLAIGIIMFGYGNVFLNVWPFDVSLAKLDFNVNMETQWWFSIVPFFMLGFGLRRTKINKVVWQYGEQLLLLAFVGYFIEVMIIQKFNLKMSTTICLFTYPIVYLLIIFALKHPYIGTEKLARYSSGIANSIYFSHILFVLILQRTGLSETPVYIITVAITILLGVIIVRSNNKILKRII